MVTEQLGEQQCLESLRRPLDEEPEAHWTQRGTRKGPGELEGDQWGEFLWGVHAELKALGGPGTSSG